MESEFVEPDHKKQKIESNKNIKLIAIEFYSGIGGMHFSLEAAGKELNVQYQVIEAIDININANKVYKLNFGKEVNQKSIESITPKQIDKLNANMWLMSPPCQPYTRQGSQKGSKDQRAKSFLYLIDILPQLNKQPDYIIIENVKGFELSDTRNILVNQLSKCNYSIKEFLLSPIQLFIPNSRLRYFLLAKKQPLHFSNDNNNNSQVKYSIPGVKMNGEEKELTSEILEETFNNCYPISNYIESLSNDAMKSYIMPDSLVLKYGRLVDIVLPDSKRSACFTKGYFTYCEGTGSVLQTAEKEKKGISGDSQSLLQLKLRYFTPREIANIHGFPSSFKFPEEITQKQRYMLLGNSLSVFVVKELIKYLIKEEIEIKL